MSGFAGLHISNTLRSYTCSQGDPKTNADSSLADVLKACEGDESYFMSQCWFQVLSPPSTETYSTLYTSFITPSSWYDLTRYHLLQRYWWFCRFGGENALSCTISIGDRMQTTHTHNSIRVGAQGCFHERGIRFLWYAICIYARYCRRWSQWQNTSYT